jgi:hypothetical protein
MFLFDFFRSFLPLRNPIGFGAADFLELALVALLVLLILARRGLEARAQAWISRTGWWMLAFAVLPIALRAALLAHHPVPVPEVCDEFSYLMLADTLSHFHLANPQHPMHRFFEALFVQHQPTYSSIYPIGQGIALAFGRMIFGHPWIGVLLAAGAFCSLCYWMLRAWTTPGWAAVGGMLTVFVFGPLNLWINGYWGGAVSATAGCLVFGGLPRLLRDNRARDAVLVGLGLGLQTLCRPFESLFLDLSVLVLLAPALRDAGRRRLIFPRLLWMGAAAAPALLLMLLQNHAVTGNWMTMPYMLSRYQYGIPTTFTFQTNPTPRLPLNQEQQVDYEVQKQVHGAEPESPGRYVERWAGRIRFYRFFFFAPLYAALPFLLLSWRESRLRSVVACLAIFSLGANFYPYFYPHYIAAAACLLVLLAVMGLEALSRLRLRNLAVGEEAARALLLLCAAHFLFWYSLHLSNDTNLALPLWRFESWDNINHGDPQGRRAIADRLARAPGKHLVFVRYGPRHLLEEWVHNTADIDSGRIVWAGDLGPDENPKLQHYYPDRTAWLLEPDLNPPRLRPYPGATTSGP